ncbi:transposase domain-containing protein [Streptomyces althioticus]|uniref:transposase domain-containing protein n=1 Tax=Streptomyces althioticus TaxID=83380 RepID=UPI003EBB4728
MCLFARESYEEVLRVLTSGIPGSRALARVNRSSLCRARARIGEDVLETLFHQVAVPLATRDTPGAWRRGLRLLALDGTQPRPERGWVTAARRGACGGPVRGRRPVSSPIGADQPPSTRRPRALIPPAPQQWQPCAGAFARRR